MISRREALSLLGAAGIGTAAFQRAMAAQAGAGQPITRQSVIDAEWVAGIQLSDQQREMAAKVLNQEAERLEHLRSTTLDYDLAPPFVFKPLVNPASSPDPRSYQKTITKPKDTFLARPSSDEELAFMPLRKLGRLLRSRQISSTELTKLYLERLHRFDPLLKCVVTFTDELALEQAKRADEELSRGHDRGPLQGIPWGAKDILAYPGYPTTWGAPQYRDRIIHEKAAVIERLEEAGAVMIAKLATGAFAGVNFWERGVTRNPWNPHQSALGSSSGPASATAAGLVGFSVGTETMGSIIFPCARCGAVGLRPTFGRVSRYGCMPLGWTLDKIGPICRTVDDCGLVLASIHGADLNDPSSVDRKYLWPTARELSTIRVGYTESSTREDDLQILRELGVQLVPIELPTLPEDISMPLSFLECLVTMESSAVFEDLTLAEQPKGVKLWPYIWCWGHFLTAIDYLKLSRIRTLLMRQMDEVMRAVDVCIGDEGRTITNLTGHPKIILPKQFRKEEGFTVPRAQAFFGRIYDETTLLHVAAEYQRATTGEEHQRPPLDQFLKDIDSFLADEEYPDENKLYDR